MSDELLQNRGLGNEIGFYIFDYPPQYELEVREHIQFILRKLPQKKPGLRVVHINLFAMLIDYLKSRDLLDRAIAMQKKHGDKKLLNSLKGPLDPLQIADYFVKTAEPDNQDLVLVSGVGNAYPMLRSHKLLNNLHSRMGDTPVVLFYPGVYTGQGLQLFGKLKESNYYRAFRLVA